MNFYKIASNLCIVRLRRSLHNSPMVTLSKFRAVVFAQRSCQSREEDRSSETLTVNQRSPNCSTTLANLGLMRSRGSSKKSGKVSNRTEM